MNRDNENTYWTKIIQPDSGWFDLHLRELWRYRDLVTLFVRRNFVSVYKQTILGPLWYLLQPIFSTLVFTVIFGNIAKLPTDGLPHMVFYMSGIVTWNYFTGCLTQTSHTFVSNAGIFGKVYFPRLTVPISVVITNLLQFAIQFGLFLGFFFYFYFRGASIHPNWWIFFMPLLILQMACLGLGLGIIVSSLTTKYRDLTYLVAFGVQLWMYATPIVYPISLVPSRYQWLLALNPMSATVEVFRYAFLGAGSIRPYHIGMSAATTFFCLAVGVIIFSRVEKTFMDTV
jgi:lipopolysaccharide transport system permease protein